MKEMSKCQAEISSLDCPVHVVSLFSAPTGPCRRNPEAETEREPLSSNLSMAVVPL